MSDPSEPDSQETRWREERPSEGPASGGRSDQTSAEDPRAVASMEKFLGLNGRESTPDNAPPADHRPVAGDGIAGYEILGELGRGGMGVVYKARQQRPARLVALKVIRGGQAGAEALARFQAEAQVLALLEHPNIVHVHAVGEQDGTAFFSMEFCPGGSLARRLNGAPMPAAAAAPLAEILARAMHAAHQAGVIHRDLKPGNVLLTAGGAPKIADFGLAKQIESNSDQTHSGAVLGTPSYMSPEQAGGDAKSVGPATDVYALGAILYEMLTGRPPFRGASVLDTLEQVRSQDPVPPRRLQHTAPRDLETICLRCLHKEPKKRYDSAAALADDLRRFQQGRPILARPVGPAERAWRWCRRQPLTAASAALAAACAALLLAGAFRYTALTGEEEGNVIAARARADAAQKVADAAQEVAATRHYAALLNGVRQRAAQRKPGWTWEALSEVAEAARLDTAVRQPAELRTEAASCYAGVDVRLARTLADDFPAGGRPAFHPGGRLLALAGVKAEAWAACSVRIVDITTGDVVRDLAFPPNLAWQVGHGVQDGARSLAFSPDGRQLAVGARSGMVHCWDFNRDPPALTTWQAHPDETACVAFSPDGESLYSGGLASGVKRWPDAKPAEKAPTYPQADYGETAVSPDGAWVAVVAGGKANFLDPKTLLPLGRSFPAAYGRVAADPDGRMLAVGGDESVQLIDAADGRVVHTFRAEGREAASDGRIIDLAFSPDGALLACSSAFTGHFQLWDVPGGRLLVDRFTGGDARLVFRPDGRALAVAAKDRTLLFEVGGRLQEEVVALQPRPVVGAVVSPGGDRLACLVREGTGAGVASLWSIPHDAPAPAEGAFGPRTDVQLRPVGRWPTNLLTDEPKKLAFDWAGGRVALAQADDAVLFDTAGATAPLRLPVGRCRTIRFDAAGRLWTAAGSDVRAWSVPEGREVAHWSNAPADVLTGLGAVGAIAAGERWVLAGCQDGGVRLLGADGEHQKTFRIPGGELESAALSANEALVAVGSDKGVLTVLHLPGGEVLPGARPHDDAVVSVAFGGSFLASGSRDHTVRLWLCAVDRVEELLTLREPGPVDEVSFSADGNCLAVLVHGERAVRLWRLERLRRSLAEVGLDW